MARHQPRKVQYGSRPDVPTTTDELLHPDQMLASSYGSGVGALDATVTDTPYLQNGEALSDVVTESKIGRTWPDLAYGVLRRFKDPAIPATGVAAAIIIVGGLTGAFKTWADICRLVCVVGVWLVVLFASVAGGKLLARIRRLA